MGSVWEGLKHFAVFRLTPPFLVRLFAGPYVAGDSMDSALAVADRLHRERRICTTLDILGEEVRDWAEVGKHVDLYLQLVGSIGDRRHTSISLKPSAMGLQLDYARCVDNIRRITEQASRTGIAVTIDMEDHTCTGSTLRIHRELRQEFSLQELGTVLQSRLFRTIDDVKALGDLPSRIRLVIGIYKEQSAIAHTQKKEIKDNFLQLLPLLAKGGHYIEIGTHDERLVNASKTLLEEHGITRDRYEFQMLLGVPRARLQTRLVEAGYTVRIYVPFTEQWSDAIAYCKRRLVESPQMAAMVLKNLISSSDQRQRS